MSQGFRVWDGLGCRGGGAKVQGAFRVYVDWFRVGVAVLGCRIENCKELFGQGFSFGIYAIGHADFHDYTDSN